MRTVIENIVGGIGVLLLFGGGCALDSVGVARLVAFGSIALGGAILWGCVKLMGLEA